MMMKPFYGLLAGLLLFASGVQAQVFEYTTAKELLSAATTKAQSDFASDAFLVNVLFARITVSGISLEMDKDGANAGKTSGWVYHFHSNSLDENYLLAGLKTIISDMFYAVPTNTIPSLPFDLATELTEPWLDSPDALAAEKLAGAADFMTAHPEAEILIAATFSNVIDTEIAPAGKYWLMRFGASGLDTLTCIVNAETGASLTCTTFTALEGIPEAQGFRLDQNYPNPYSLSSGHNAVIRYALADRQNVQLVLYNALGKKVSTLYSGTQSPGEYRATVSKDAFPAPGIYFYRLQTEKGSDVQRMIVVK